MFLEIVVHNATSDVEKWLTLHTTFDTYLSSYARTTEQKGTQHRE